jgi:hypothetical protein
MIGGLRIIEPSWLGFFLIGSIRSDGQVTSVFVGHLKHQGNNSKSGMEEYPVPKSCVVTQLNAYEFLHCERTGGGIAGFQAYCILQKHRIEQNMKSLFYSSLKSLTIPPS